MNTVKKSVVRYARSVASSFAKQRRDTRYVFVTAVSLFVFAITCLQAFDKGLFDSVERPIFEAVNNLPQSLNSLMYGLTQLGGMGSLPIWIGAAWYLINRRAALILAGGGTAAWFLAKIAKAIVARGRPGDVLESVRLFGGEVFGGYGFPSGHATFAAACATLLYFQVERKYRKYLILIAVLVGISRMYIGAHFPLDIVGGWALGALVAAIVSLVFGMSQKDISAHQIKAVLRKRGHDITSLRFANLDARGSRPVFMTAADGRQYFGKIFGVQEHAADWLFKIYRFFRYKNFQAEEPYINSRRNIEMESFATLWARQSGVRVPLIVDMVKIGSSWLLIQDKLDAICLADHGNIRQKSLVDAWRQVAALHAVTMAHRDLRAANLMIDKKGDVWIIDFGFAEVSAPKQRRCMDVAELLMSMSLVVGVHRTVDAAMEVLPPETMTRVLPYLKREVFSGDTAKKLKSNKSLLDDLKQDIQQRLAIDDDVDEADIIRINSRKIINLVLLGVFFYLIVPQFNDFKSVFGTLSDINPMWFVLIGLLSVATYVVTGLIYVILSSVPLRLGPTALAQLAASFMSKVVPGGVGSTGLNIRYMQKAGIDTVDAAAILMANAGIGFVMFALPLSLFLLFNGHSLASLWSFNVTATQLIAAVCAIALAGLVVAASKTLRHKLLSTISRFVTSIRDITNTPQEVLMASAASLTVSVCYILCLYACIRAYGVDIGLAGAVLVYASAIIAKSVVPTPGGLGPFEIAMVSVMAGLNVAKPEAIAVVVLYRLATFWLPIPFSILAYRYLSHRKLI